MTGHCKSLRGGEKNAVVAVANFPCARSGWNSGKSASINDIPVVVKKQRFGAFDMRIATKNGVVTANIATLEHLTMFEGGHGIESHLLPIADNGQEALGRGNSNLLCAVGISMNRYIQALIDIKLLATRC